MTIVEQRLFQAGDVRTFCIKHNLYTRGTCDEYDRMLSMANGVINTERLYRIALDIVEHSDFEDSDLLQGRYEDPMAEVLETMMYDLGQITVALYKIVDDNFPSDEDVEWLNTKFTTQTRI